MSGKKSLQKKPSAPARSSRERVRVSIQAAAGKIETDRTSVPQSSAPPLVRGLERQRHDSESKSASLGVRLKRTKTLFAALEDLAEAGVWEVDPSRNEFRYSANLAKIFGLPLSPGTLPFAELACRLEPEDPESVEARIAEVLNSGLSMVHYSEHAQTSEGARNCRTVYIPLPACDSYDARVAGITQDISAVRDAEDKVRCLTQRLLSAQSEEQRRLSRNLHETVSQTIASVKLTLGKIGRSLPDGASDAARGVEAACELVEDALREVRTVAALLHPPLLEEAGLCAALRSYVRSFSERSGLRITLKCPGRLARMAGEIEVSVFRIVQESLTNIHRHARAKNALIRVTQSDRLMSFDVCDDGVGIPEHDETGAPFVPYGVGIAGMRERVHHLNGAFRIHGIRGGGTVVSVSLPIEPNPKNSVSGANQNARTNPAPSANAPAPARPHRPHARYSSVPRANR
jgi:signal transduction histidine kinase